MLTLANRNKAILTGRHVLGYLFRGRFHTISVESNARAKAYWDMYLVNAAPGHLTAMDAPLLARLCVALGYADEANEKIDATGMLVKAPNTGLPIQSPYLPVLNRQTEIARKLAAELSLPPAQRDRVGTYNAPNDEPNPWAVLRIVRPQR
jgi:P27 family predicted phage terminase small subunit